METDVGLLSELYDFVRFCYEKIKISHVKGSLYQLCVIFLLLASTRLQSFMRFTCLSLKICKQKYVLKNIVCSCIYNPYLVYDESVFFWYIYNAFKY